MSQSNLTIFSIARHFAHVSCHQHSFLEASVGWNGIFSVCVLSLSATEKLLREHLAEPEQPRLSEQGHMHKAHTQAVSLR